MKKRVVALLLGVVMVMSTLAGCGAKEETTNETTESKVEATTEATTEESATEAAAALMSSLMSTTRLVSPALKCGLIPGGSSSKVPN